MFTLPNTRMSKWFQGRSLKCHVMNRPVDIWPSTSFLQPDCLSSCISLRFHIFGQLMFSRFKCVLVIAFGKMWEPLVCDIMISWKKCRNAVVRCLIIPRFIKIQSAGLDFYVTHVTNRSVSHGGCFPPLTLISCTLFRRFVCNSFIIFLPVIGVSLWGMTYANSLANNWGLTAEEAVWIVQHEPHCSSLSN